MRTLNYFVIAPFLVGLPVVPVAAAALSEDERMQLCEEVTNKLADMIILLRGKGKLDEIQDSFAASPFFRSNQVSPLILSRMLYAAQAAPTLTKQELRADGYAYCVGIVK